MQAPSRSSNNSQCNSLNSSTNLDSVENSPKSHFKRASLRNLARFIKSSDPLLTSSDIEKKLKNMLSEKSLKVESKKNRAAKLFKSAFSWIKNKKERDSKISDDQLDHLLLEELRSIRDFGDSFKKLISEIQAEKASLALSKEQLNLLRSHEPIELKTARARGESLHSYNNYDRQLFHENKMSLIKNKLSHLKSTLEKKRIEFDEYRQNLNELGKDYGAFSKLIKEEVIKLQKTFTDLQVEYKKGSKKLTLVELELISDLKNIDQDTFNLTIPTLSNTIFNEPMYIKIPLETDPSTLLTFDLEKKNYEMTQRPFFIYHDKSSNSSLYMGSGYPLKGEKREGDPIADDMLLAEFKNSDSDILVFSGADGCNWGKNPRLAAEIVNRTFLTACRESFAKEFLNTQDAVKTSLQSLLMALNAIFEKTQEIDSHVSPSTTHLGMIIKRKSDTSAIGTLISLGDMKVFIRRADGDIEELTMGNRLSQDAADPGGRLSGDTLTLDGRNLRVMTLKLNKGDTLLPMSDGIHDNLSFTPTLTPSEVKAILFNSKFLNNKQRFYLNSIDLPNDWSTPSEALNRLRSIYACVKIKELDENGQTISLAEKLIKHAYELTKPSREFMELNPQKKLPNDYALFPGKLDHVSIAQIVI